MCTSKEVQPWIRYFDLGFVYQTFYLGRAPKRLSVPDTIRPIVEDDFFQAVEITSIKNANEKTRVKTLLEKSDKLVIFSGVTPVFQEGLNLSDISEKNRSSAVKRMLRYFDEAHYFNARVFLIASGPDPGEGNRGKAKEQLKSSIIDLWEYGEKKDYNKDTTLSMEIFDRDADIKFLFGPTSESAEFAKEIKEIEIKFSLTVDQGHLYLMKENPLHSLREAKGLAYHFHLGNCVVRDSKSPAFGAKHPAFGFPGGEVSFREISSFLSILKGNQYFDGNGPWGKPILSFEVKPMPGEEHKVVFDQSKREFLKAWKLFEAC